MVGRVRAKLIETLGLEQQLKERDDQVAELTRKVQELTEAITGGGLPMRVRCVRIWSHVIRLRRRMREICIIWLCGRGVIRP